MFQNSKKDEITTAYLTTALDTLDLDGSMCDNLRVPVLTVPVRPAHRDPTTSRSQDLSLRRDGVLVLRLVALSPHYEGWQHWGGHRQGRSVLRRGAHFTAGFTVEFDRLEFLATDKRWAHYSWTAQFQSDGLERRKQSFLVRFGKRKIFIKIKASLG
jgi:hypothetical protein